MDFLYYLFNLILQFIIEKYWKNISINLKITLAILNDICYYIDKDRYTDGVKCTNTNIIITI